MIKGRTRDAKKEEPGVCITASTQQFLGKGRLPTAPGESSGTENEIKKGLQDRNHQLFSLCARISSTAGKSVHMSEISSEEGDFQLCLRLPELNEEKS
jgi:hypothetical protein